MRAASHSLSACNASDRLPFEVAGGRVGGANRSTYWGESLQPLGRIAPPTGANRSRGVAGLLGENLAFPAFRGG